MLQWVTAVLLMFQSVHCLNAEETLTNLTQTLAGCSSEAFKDHQAQIAAWCQPIRVGSGRARLAHGDAGCPMSASIEAVLKERQNLCVKQDAERQAVLKQRVEAVIADQRAQAERAIAEYLKNAHSGIHAAMRVQPAMSGGHFGFVVIAVAFGRNIFDGQVPAGIYPGKAYVAYTSDVMNFYDAEPDDVDRPSLAAFNAVYGRGRDEEAQRIIAGQGSAALWFISNLHKKLHIDLRRSSTAASLGLLDHDLYFFDSSTGQDCSEKQCSFATYQEAESARKRFLGDVESGKYNQFKQVVEVTAN